MKLAAKPIPERHPPWLIAAVIAAITFAVFSPALRNGFLYWDDQDNILLNFNFRGLSPSHLKWMFTSFHMGHYTPLAWLTLALDYSFWGLNPVGYHLGNVLLHSANAVIFYFVSRRLFLLARPELADGPSRSSVDWAAAISALLFAIHPLRVESVAWITQRRDVLAAFFVLLSILFYVKSVTHRKRPWASLGLYALSLMSKTSGMVLPVILIVLDFYPLKRRAWLEKIPYVILAIPAAALAMAAQFQSHAAFSFKELGLAERLGIAGYGAVFYLWKTFVPLHLSPLYDTPVALFGPFSPLVIGSLMTLILSAFLIVWRKSWPAVLAAWVSYLVFLSPTSGLVQSGSQLTADRYTYLSCLGWPLLVGSTFLIYGRYKKVIILGTLLISISICYLTFVQSRIWHDDEMIWSHALEVNPQSPGANAHLGGALMRTGRLEEAGPYIKNALILLPNSEDTNYQMGIFFMQSGSLDEATRYFEHALAIDPNHEYAEMNLGVVLLNLHRTTEAVAHLEHAAQLGPQIADIHVNLGCAYAIQKRMAESIAEFEKALELDPNSKAAQTNLQHALSLAPRSSL